jgi:hypothetical protein
VPVNTFTARDQFDSSSAMDASGDYVVTWTSMTQDGASGGNYGQRYNSAGVAQGVEFKVNSTTAIETSRALARNEGIAGGISSGAAVAAALQIGKRPESAGKTILVIVPSFAERYLSTALFEGI